jgi:hypothetical protein
MGSAIAPALIETRGEGDKLALTLERFNRLLKNDPREFSGNHRTACPSEKRDGGHFREAILGQDCCAIRVFQKQGFFQQPVKQ